MNRLDMYSVTVYLEHLNTSLVTMNHNKKLKIENLIIKFKYISCYYESIILTSPVVLAKRFKYISCYYESFLYTYFFKYIIPP